MEKVAKKRNIALDAGRVFACFWVVAAHSPMTTDNAIGVVQLCISYIAVGSFGLFFMISGTLLLPVQIPTIDFLRRRVTKIIWPTLSWTFIYMLILSLRGKPDLFNPVTILSIPFSLQSCPILWFMYSILGLYLIAPIISPWLKGLKWPETKFYLILFAIAFSCPVLGVFLMVTYSYDSALYYFFGFGGYFFMGWVMKNYGSHFKFWWLALGFVLSWLAAAFCRMSGFAVDFYSLFWYRSIFVVVMSVFWYKLFVSEIKWWDRLSGMAYSVITKISNLSFGIYLCHYAVIRYWLWDLDWIRNIQSYILQTLTITIVAFLLSVALSYVLSYLPFGKYLVGCSSRKKL